MKVPVLKYTGFKHGNGIYQWIINEITPHKRYFELFAGSAAIYFRKSLAESSILPDVERNAILSGIIDYFNYY